MTFFYQHLTYENLDRKPANSKVRWVIGPALLTMLSLSVSIPPVIANAERLDHKKVNMQKAKPSRNRTLAAIRRATKPFADVTKALEAGYLSSVDLGGGCVSARSEGYPSQLGAMGIHFVNLAEIGTPDFDFRSPSVLVYAPDPDVENCSYTTDELLGSNTECADSLRLVAVEELILADLWEATIDKPHWEQPPEFLGNQFYYVHDNPETFWVDEAHAFPPHYELHIWLYDRNPTGLFATWNPTLTCPAHMQGQ